MTKVANFDHKESDQIRSPMFIMWTVSKDALRCTETFYNHREIGYGENEPHSRRLMDRRGTAKFDRRQGLCYV